MRVVDTSAWIEWLTRSPAGACVADVFPDRAQQVVPTIVQLELAHWMARELSDASADAIIADTEQCIVAPLDTRIALRAAECKRSHCLATADAIVYATALEYGADVVTCDAHFEGLPNVIYVAKKAS